MGHKDNTPISGWYCKCKVSDKTVGCCAHVTSVLRYARNPPHSLVPSKNPFIQDAENTIE